MAFTRLANLALVSFWIIAFAGLLVLISWLYAPGVVDIVDDHFREIYLYEPTDRYARIIARYEATGDHAAAVEELTRYLQDMDDVQKVDELGDVKTVTYTQLVRIFIRVAQLEQARYWTEQWLAYDPKDVQGLLSRAQLLMLSPETFDEGKYQLEILKQQFPHSLPVSTGAAVAHASSGQLGLAFQELAPYLDNSAPMKRQIDKPLTTYTWQHLAGSEPREMVLLFDSGEALELHVSQTPVSASTKFEYGGLKQTEYGYLKEPGPNGLLSLRTFDAAEDLEIKVRSIVARPEVLSTLMQPRFRQLLVSQLNELGDTKSLETYETYAATL